MQLVALGLNSNKKVELVPISSDEAAGLHRLLVVEFNPVMQGTNCDERVPCPENQQDGSARIVMIVKTALTLLETSAKVMRIKYSREQLLNLNKQELQMPYEMQEEVRMHSDLRIHTPDEVNSIREAAEERDDKLKILNSDEDLKRPVSKIWCSKFGALERPILDWMELKALAKDIRSAFEANEMPSSPNPLSDPEQLNEAIKQHRDSILFLGHLFVAGSMSASAYCCLHKIALCQLSYYHSERDQLWMDGLQETLEKLMMLVSRSQHILAYFCDIDKALNQHIGKAQIWNDLFAKQLRLAIRERAFQPKSEGWKAVCNKIRLHPKPDGVENLARQSREIFTNPEIEEHVGLEEQYDCIVFTAYLVNQDENLKSSTAFECMVELLSWRLRSTDGNLDDAQQVVRRALDEILKYEPRQSHLFEEKLSKEEKEALESWEAAAKKDTYFYYERPDLLSGYTKKHMPKKVKKFKISFERQLRKHLDKHWNKKTNSFRVLSLGCGPGSELLAVLDVWAERTNQQGEFSCIGVDKFWWPKKAFLTNCCRISNASVKSVFVQQDMMEFVQNSVTEFDIAVLSFVGGVFDSAEVFVEDLARLLPEDGAIFLIDNYTNSGLNLLNLGFYPTAIWLSLLDERQTTAEELHLAKFCLVYRKCETKPDDEFQVFLQFCDASYGFVSAKQSNMPYRKRLHAYTSAVKALRNNACRTNVDYQLIAKEVEKHVQEASNETSSLTCVVVDDDEFNSESEEFFLFRQSDTPRAPWLLLSKTVSD
uniref:Methyltransf_25 domain-containing protein n=1 Tax=Macrostomum lignano TaxID=282301 RepID=A0A1I8FYA5_9PLAT